MTTRKKPSALTPHAWLCEWPGWRQTHIADEDPLPDKWDDEPPTITALFALTPEDVAAVNAARGITSRKPIPAPGPRARWIDAFGQKYTSHANGYTPGQFSPTGSRLLRYLPSKPKAKATP